jgi:TPR repeat protein
MNYLRWHFIALITTLAILTGPAIAEGTLLTGEFGKYAAELDRLSKLAYAGDAQAQYDLAKQLIRSGLIGGVESKPNYAQARDFAERAARQGHVAAQGLLGYLQTQGLGGPPDLVNGVRWLTRAAEAGDALAQANLAAAYTMGTGVGVDPVASFKWNKRSAEQGSADGAFGLAYAYANGTGTPRNPEMAVHWYKKAANQSHVHAMHNLGMAFARGDGTAKDRGSAILWLSLATRLGSERSAAQLPALVADLPRVRTREATSVLSEMKTDAPKMGSVPAGATLYRLDTNTQWTMVYAPDGHIFGFIPTRVVMPWSS